MLNWKSLDSIDQLNVIRENSFSKPQVIFKHSTRCSTSSLALSRMGRSELIPDADFYLVDLIRFRAVSDKLAYDYNIYHASPQVLLIKNGECIYDESHLGISMEELYDRISSMN